MYLLPQKFRSSRRRCFVKEGLQLYYSKEAPVLRSNKNTYFEKHLWAAASENQHLTDKFRSSRPEVFCKKDVLKNSTKFTVKHLFQSPLFNKVAGLSDSGSANLNTCCDCFCKFTEGSWFLIVFFYSFKTFSVLNFAMAEWFCHVTCFSKVYPILFFFSYKHGIFIIKRL